MPNFRDTLDELFIEKLGFEFKGDKLAKPDIDGLDNIIEISKEYSAKGIDVVVVICIDRIIEFQKKVIKYYKSLFPDSHFLFISHNGKVFDLYNVSVSKLLKKITYNEIESNTRLFKEKIEFFNVDEAEGTVDLKINIEKSFDVNDKITKSFYREFSKFHNMLQDSIEGIKDKDDLQWYASVLMNRIMFIYFLQKHFVIQNNPNFLLKKFDQVEINNEDYYKDFLLPLFFYGFAKRDDNPEKKKFIKKYGEIKYLNGGLFYPHNIEIKYEIKKSDIIENVKLKEIFTPHPINSKISVKADKLKEILKFLDGYTWYLDNRPLKNEKAINPDILGYIFEQYVNNRSDLGAYYTKEDITNYISKSTIIPFILDKLRDNGFDAPDPNPMITNNENIEQNILDYLESKDDFKLFKFLYFDILKPLSVLDPAVGSGAFLFASLNILLPIYRKTVFKLKSFKNKHKKDGELLQLCHTLSHHSEEYFLTKQIILNNLYGVDIVEEATEICKLRLFLQLASHLPDIKEIEPLPDIDFNIYSGNSLVGGISWDDLINTYSMKLFDRNGNKIEEETIKKNIKKLESLKSSYRNHQQSESYDEEISEKLKNEIKETETRLNTIIDIGVENPLHWFIEFNNIIDKGGFNVIIGNPPYVIYSDGKFYKVKNYLTVNSRNLYVLFVERIFKLISNRGNWSFITPISISSAPKMNTIRNIILKNNSNVWTSHFAWRPSKLFSGANMLLTISIGDKNIEDESSNENLFTTKYIKWYSYERNQLFLNLKYTKVPPELLENKFPKFDSKESENIIRKISMHKNKLSSYFLTYRTEYFVNYFRAVLYWIKILDYNPYMTINGKLTETSEMKKVYLKDDSVKNIIGSVLSSSTFYLYYMIYSSCQVINSDDFNFKFDIKRISSNDLLKLNKLGKEYFVDLKSNSKIKTRIYKGNFVQEKEHFKIKLSKEIINEIDMVLKDVYQFSIDEYKYIINYDLRFRMGEEDEI